MLIHPGISPTPVLLSSFQVGEGETISELFFLSWCCKKLKCCNDLDLNSLFLALPEIFFRHRWTYHGAAIPLCCDMLLAEGFKVFFIQLKCRLLPKKSNTFTVDCQQRWVSDVTDDLNLLISWEILLLENTERSMLFYQLYKLLTPRWTNLAV